jgi:tRNA(Ile2) C34 agmatinyltransferase TiaS
MKLCPHCGSFLRYYGRYRCNQCHIWLEESDCLEIRREQLPIVEDASMNGMQEGRSEPPIEDQSDASELAR